jgi:uncharacterized protein
VIPTSRRARGASLIAFCAADLALITLALVVYSNTWLDPLVRMTGGLVNNTLLVHVLGLPLVIGVVVLWFGRLRPAEVGLLWSDLPRAIALVLLLWVAAQVLGLALALATADTLQLNPLWERRGASGVLGLLLAQVLGNALLEEVGYRGFLMPQLNLRLSWVADPRRRMALAVGTSQALFALMHLPNRLRQGHTGADLAWSLSVVFALGVLFAFLYLRTGNLLIVVGVHALVNTPTLIIATPVGSEIVEVLAVLLILMWPRLTTLQRGGVPDLRRLAVAEMAL